MQIRKCLKSDVAAAGAFYDRVVSWLDAHVNYPKWTYGVYPSLNSVKARMKEGTQYVCLEGDDIVGAFVLNTDPEGNYRKGHWKKDLPDGTFMVIHALAVDPAMHGKGIGSSIIRFCEKTAKEQGHKALRLDIIPDNIPAKRMYEKCGFTWAGDEDLERGIPGLDVFGMYEKNW